MDFRKELEELFIEQKRGEESRIFDFELCAFVRDILLPNREKIPTLYRYSPADYNNIRALEKQELYLSESGNLNDVFEGLSCGIPSSDLTDALIRLHDLSYLKSFTEKESDLVMWGTYADSYAGMCVAYDCSRFEDESLYYHLFPVRYSDVRRTKANVRRMANELYDLKRALEESNDPAGFDSLMDTMGLFLTKSSGWADEREWRLIVTHLQKEMSFDECGEDQELAPLYAINSQFISFPYAKAVYLGPRMRNDIKEHLCGIGKKLGIPVYEMMLANDSYKLTY